MITLHWLYALAGAMFAAFALLSAVDKSNKKRLGNAAFWGLMALSLLGGDIIGDFGNGRLVLGLAGLDLVERNHFGARRLDLGLVLIVGRMSDRRSGDAAHRGRLKDSAAFRADSGIPVEIVEFRAAAHALALQAEFRFGHG